MIKINLLPIKDDKYVRSAYQFLTVAGVLLVMVLFLLIMNSSILSQKEEAARRDIAEADKEIANLRTMIGKINELKQKKKDLQEKIAMIMKLQDQNIGPVRVLDELSLKLPSNKIWIKDLKLNGKRMTLNGESLENQEVASFMKQLENSLFFSRIDLKEIKKKGTVRAIPILNYSMNMAVHLSGKKAPKAKKQPVNQRRKRARR